MRDADFNISVMKTASTVQRSYKLSGTGFYHQAPKTQETKKAQRERDT